MAGRPPIGPVAQDVAVTTILTAIATPCPNANGANATFVIGVVNNSLLAQTCTLVIYDNASAASGTVVASIGPLGISQVISFPGPGIRLLYGATAIASASPVAAGIQVITR